MNWFDAWFVAEDTQRTMANGIDRSVLAAEGSAAVRSQVTLANAARAAGPPLLFGFRLWASVCLALFVAFWLELDNPLTRRTITNEDDLVAELKAVRQQGYALSEGEYVSELYCVAAPIHNRDTEVVAAIGIGATAADFEMNREKWFAKSCAPLSSPRASEAGGPVGPRGLTGGWARSC
jgi:hypothetical protein